MTTQPVDGWLDSLDEAILSGLRGLHVRVDPPPGMAERMLLSLVVHREARQ